MDELLVVAAWLFAVTHLDTLLVLVAFSVDEAYRNREVLVGHYVGFSLGLAGAVVGAIVAAELLEGWTFVLGLLPIGIGVWAIARRRYEEAISDEAVTAGAWGRVGIVISAGIGLSGENIALFIPFFAGLSPAALAAVVLGYLLAAGVVYLLAVAIARATASTWHPGWIDRWFVPAVLITVGTYVFVTGWLIA